MGEYQKARMDRVRGQADLIYRNGVFYLGVVVDVPEQPEYKPEGVMGVDLSIVNIATDSDGNVFIGKQVDAVRERYAKLRAELQRAGTKSAKKHLKKLSGKEKRFRRDFNHCISKKLVAKAKGTCRAIALEDLSGIQTVEKLYRV